MSVSNKEDPKIYGGLYEERFKLRPQVRTLAGNITLNVRSAPIQVMDPGGAGRNVTLPRVADSEGLVFFIANAADDTEILTVKHDAADNSGATVITPTQAESGFVFCDGTKWWGVAGANS